MSNSASTPSASGSRSRMAVVKVTVGERKADFGRRGQRPRQRARSRAAQGSRQVPELHRGPQADRLPGPYPQRRHRGGHAGPDRERGRERRALDHHRGVAQHHRRLVPGADGFDRLQAGEVGCAGVAARRNGHKTADQPRRAVAEHRLAGQLRGRRHTSEELRWRERPAMLNQNLIFAGECAWFRAR